MAKTFCTMIVVMWGVGVCECVLSTDSGPQGAVSSVVNDRLDKLERFILEQQENNAHQEHLLRLQDARLSHQEMLLRHQQSLLRQQESLLRQQDAKLAHQENMLRQQDNMGRQQDNMGRQQDNMGRKQDSVLRQQETKLSRQDQLLSQSGQILQQTHTNTSARQGVTTTSPESAHKQYVKNNLTSAYHDIITRGVYAGTCEGACTAVVNQISQQVTQIEADIQALKNTNIQQDRNIQDAQSSIYVHWGTSYCGSASELVYSGVMGGSPWTQPGAATNYLCLTKSPVFGSMDAPSSRADLYGAEYATEDSHDDLDPVCSVCRSTFSTTVMIPGTNVCSPGWHLLYNGYLMAGDFTHKAGSEFICVDSLMDSRELSGADQLAKLLVYTVTQCGSLPCRPYASHKVVTCAVCGK